MEEKSFIKNRSSYDFIRWMDIVRKEVDNQSDRATIIVMASILEYQLEKLFDYYLLDSKTKKELFCTMGVLSTFSNKINMAYCLGLISEHEQATLNTIRKIRNKFAHNIDLEGFASDSSVVDLIGNLSIPYGMYLPASFQVVDNEAQPFDPSEYDRAEPKERLLLTFNYLSLYLNTRALYFEKCKSFEPPVVSELMKKPIDLLCEKRSEIVKILTEEKEFLTQAKEFANSPQASDEEAQTLSRYLEKNDEEELNQKIQKYSEDLFSDMQDKLNIPYQDYKKRLLSAIAAIEKSYSKD